MFINLGQNEITFPKSGSVFKIPDFMREKSTFNKLLNMIVCIIF